MSIYNEWARLRNTALTRIEGYAPSRTITDIQLIRKRLVFCRFIRVESNKSVVIAPTLADPNRLCAKVYPEYVFGIFCFKISITLPSRKHRTLI